MQWIKNEPMAKPTRMGGAIWLHKRAFRHWILRFIFLQRRLQDLHLYETRSLRRWTSLVADQDPFLLGCLRRFPAAFSVCLQRRSGSPAAIQFRGSRRSESSEPTQVEPPRASLSPHTEVSPVLFAHPDQRSFAASNDLVSFGESECGNMDDSISLAASDAEELLGSSHEPAPCRSTQPSAASSWPNWYASCLTL